MIPRSPFSDTATTDSEPPTHLYAAVSTQMPISNTLHASSFPHFPPPGSKLPWLLASSARIQIHQHSSGS